MLWREHIGNRQRYHFPHRKVEKLKRKNADGKAKWVIAIFRFRVRRVERLLFALSVWLKCTTGFGGDKKVCRGELECAPDIDCHKFPSMRATIDFFNTLMLYLTHSSRFFCGHTPAHSVDIDATTSPEHKVVAAVCFSRPFTTLFSFTFDWATNVPLKRIGNDSISVAALPSTFILCARCLNGRWIQFGGLR